MNRLGRRLLAYLSSSEVKSAVLGDMEEIYAERLRERGAARTKIWFWLQVLESAPFLVGDSWLRRRNRRGNAPSAFSSFIRVAGLSFGLACCLTLVVITRWIQNDPSSAAVGPAPTAVHETIGESPSDRPPAGLRRASPSGPRPEVDAAGLPVRTGKRRAGSLRRLDDQRLFGHASRLFTLEFLIMFAGGLGFINSFRVRPSPRRLRARLRTSAFRSAAFILLTFGFAFLFGMLLWPYFRFRLELRIAMYWLVCFWLFVGAVFHIFPAIILSLSPKKDRPDKARRLAVVNLAFSLAFLLGTVLIFQELDRLKSAQEARDQVRASAMLPLGADGGLESRLSR